MEVLFLKARDKPAQAGEGADMGKRTRVARELRYHYPPGHPWPDSERPDEDEGDGDARVREPRKPLPLGPAATAMRDPRRD